ncbi:tRNA (N6-isopentenyl adenosine(37)-C2)-methylthiotransferase MiaB [Desulfovibrio litoralis]|uniref:tRNA-2-methylthio-N(6)-dimethylallyladenosine synthase n=1 Tax=Desulfovibrio litoralis DSM 11393 TaxID=1121455 RepID=A0A1M7SB79_9BACT|nr:tRNA (N6-isopentenyl adenosine(37)-C2)-methylthiotransferase MiaB [Desulfovibrio litoralis]SHN55733.1 tRNA-i(6)A37 thiotransferase enzyme MiaB [Desulfovibrio litoralis DSM 11393]
MSKLPTFYIFTFGCQMNANDSDWLKRALLSYGFEYTTHDKAELIIFNTCSVRDKPEQKVYSEIGRFSKIAQRKKRKIMIAVGGCVAQQVGKTLLSRFPLVKLVFGTDNLAQVPKFMLEVAQDSSKRFCLTDFNEEINERTHYFEMMNVKEQSGSAFVNIMQGCDNFCSYCIVPYVRGRQKSRNSQAILDECQGLIEKGCRELTLLGQNVNSYGQDKTGDGTNFSSLLKQLLPLKGLERLHFMTAHPKDISDELIELLGSEKKLSPRLHLPIQSGSDKILKLMNRKYTVKDYLLLVEKVRKVRSDIQLSTDMMVGFPDESDLDFKDTLTIMNEIRFLDIYSYIYSDRPNTKSLMFNNKIERKLGLERLSILQEQQKEYTKNILSAMLGNITEVFVDTKISNQQLSVTEQGILGWQGKDHFDTTVNLIVKEDIALNGLIVPSKIIETGQHSLVAVQVGKAW